MDWLNGKPISNGIQIPADVFDRGEVQLGEDTEALGPGVANGAANSAASA